MDANETLVRIVNNANLISHPLKYCLVGEHKMPYRIDGSPARPNNINDFCDIETLIEKANSLDLFSGIGISVQASNISAIDVDSCFSIPFDISSGDDRANDIISIFREKAYVEFSFSGKGMRVLFTHNEIDDYKNKYYIKNDKTHCEYYYPQGSARYVTLTGATICDNPLNLPLDDELILFLKKYMARPNENKKCLKSSDDICDTRSIEELLREVKCVILFNNSLLDLWYDTDHFALEGQSRESNKDYALLKLLYLNVTQDKDKLRLLFEESPYFKSKDSKHLQKWTYRNHRYYNNNIYKALGKDYG